MFANKISDITNKKKKKFVCKVFLIRLKAKTKTKNKIIAMELKNLLKSLAKMILFVALIVCFSNAGTL